MRLIIIVLFFDLREEKNLSRNVRERIFYLLYSNIK